MHRWARSALTCLLLTATGCASAEHSDSSSDPVSSSVAANSAVPSPAPGPNDTAMSAPPAPVMPTQDATSSAAAVDLAQRTMAAFARPTLGAAAWFADLAPLLTPAARSAYVGTDPAEVPVRAVTGPGVAEPSPSVFLAYVVVPTDVGVYRLLLSREGGDTGWLVETITAPDGVR